MGRKAKKMRAIDFFCGGGGMTNGLIQAGMDFALEAKETYEELK